MSLLIGSGSGTQVEIRSLSQEIKLSIYQTLAITLCLLHIDILLFSLIVYSGKKEEVEATEKEAKDKHEKAWEGWILYCA